MTFDRLRPPAKMASTALPSGIRPPFDRLRPPFDRLSTYPPVYPPADRRLGSGRAGRPSSAAVARRTRMGDSEVTPRDHADRRSLSGRWFARKGPNVIGAIMIEQALPAGCLQTCRRPHRSGRSAPRSQPDRAARRGLERQSRKIQGRRRRRGRGNLIKAHAGRSSDP